MLYEVIIGIDIRIRVKIFVCLYDFKIFIVINVKI